ncbi:phosphate acetyltransferase [Geobacillus thermocatenulatus]|uniref:Phosphate acetyltransferase n=2 Tax=Anoxybacillaceae TaxID=3120669 RepID=A0A226QF15_9BACL|nr:phosphate acetyltransferase [Geobacillus thermocatenulatus]KLR74695.1 phosphotransacetylase [Geobacillus sp. T6]OXB90080.1 phosphate acetyltransferase [Geobacillus thermocatenulatus]RAN31231.1 phosphotransacetylase [Geobacillus sp. A8]
MKVAGTGRKIVFPEGTDDRILTAASRLAAEQVLQPIVLGDEQAVRVKAAALGLPLEGVEIVNPRRYGGFDELVSAFVERRKGKMTEEAARELLLDENYFGTMLVYTGAADGLVSGAAHSTADTVRPALQIIKTKPGVRKTSGVFIMVRGDEKYVFADCAINIAPDSQDLAEIAVESARTAKMFGLTPRVAMLSFSTKGSASSPETEKVAEAVRLAKEMAPDLILDGEFQFDAAFVPEVARKKAPDSVIQGDANVFIFPSLEAGNIGYKIAQRLGGFEAVGPILQGLNKPVNDLSRGCSAEDTYKLALITAVQSLGE